MTRNALILGAGRSGTSLLAGLFSETDYFLGDSLWPGNGSNPLGYFEDEEVNGINEHLLAKVVPWRPGGIVGALMPLHRDRPHWRQRWLSILPPGTAIPTGEKLERRMAALTARAPYLFKDPRFSYTLPAWMPFLKPDTTFLCSFREPQRTVNSVLKNIKAERYLRDLVVTRERAAQYWLAIYRSVLHLEATIGGDWLFVHYDEILTGRALPVLECHLGVKAKPDIVQADLARSALTGDIDQESADLFAQLMDRAESKYR